LFYISAASGITHQPTFQHAGFSGVIQPLPDHSELLTPVFKDYIDAGLLRRMSKILRMSVTCAKDCLFQAGIEQPDSIVVGTGLGCLQDTEKFLNTFLTIEGLLPPTAFIQSTHNTIAGQISLSIGNHGYNMTHTQNAVSFEHALIDAMLLLNEDDTHVLVGAADEHIPFLEKIGDELELPVQGKLTSGASFFVLSNKKTEQTVAGIEDVEVVGLVRDIPSELESFMADKNIHAGDLDLVLFPGFDGASSGPMLNFLVENGVEENRIMDFLPFSGIYPTCSAFALHYAVDRMKADQSLRNILICNHLNKKNLGLTLIRSVEA
jgi:3-oxoacyl-[acyl-carrier-protein] synthase II